MSRFQDLAGDQARAAEAWLEKSDAELRNDDPYPVRVERSNKAIARALVHATLAVVYSNMEE